jgi:hypothetical protein
MDKRVVEKNIKRMTSASDGSMYKLIGQESWGGNAGRWKGMWCSGANFVYDPETGEILYFENPQHLPKNLQDFPSGTLRIALDNETNKYRIIDYFFSPKSEEAKENLEISIEEYNKRFGFSDTPAEKRFSEARPFNTEEERIVKNNVFLEKVKQVLNETLNNNL